MTEEVKQVQRKGRTRTLKVLFTCIGRRVSLLKAFRHAARQLRLDLVCLGADVQPASPAMQLCDHRCLVHATTHRQYLSDIGAIVETHGVDLLVPTVDLDLKSLARERPRLARMGCHVLVSTPRVIELSQDKRKTYDFLIKHGIDMPRTVSAQQQLTDQTLDYPCYVKPWDGYAGKYNTLAQDRQDLEYLIKKIPHPICQAFVKGHEYTCDVYVDRSLQVRCVVPRLRLEVRSGEVSKACIVMSREIIQRASQVVQCLKAGPGVITVQLIETEDSGLKVIEINPRFGGGVPLSIRAGADFPRWILEELTGRSSVIRPGRIKDGLVMLRYDHEVWSSVHALDLQEDFS